MGTGAVWVAGVVAALVLLIGGYGLGYAHGQAECKAGTAKATGKAQERADAKTTADITRAQRAGDGRERDRLAIDRRFSELQGPPHERTAEDLAADACVLPDRRLREWAAANAGLSDPGAAAVEHDDAASAPAGPGLRPPARPGGQPSAGGGDVPPAGQPAMPASAAPGHPP